MSDEFDEFEDDEELDQDEESEEPEGEPCPVCKAPNHPPSDTRCAHNVAWTWDGQTEALGSASGFAQAWATLCNRVYEVEEDSADDARLQARALALPFGAQLVQLARQDANLADVLEQLAGAITSGGKECCVAVLLARPAPEGDAHPPVEDAGCPRQP